MVPLKSVFGVLNKLNKLTVRVTVLLVALVASAILVMAGLGYSKLYEVTATNAEVRIDRAARAAASIFGTSLSEEFTIIRDDAGRPSAVRIVEGSPETALVFRPEYDELLKEIGLNNQGAANLFKLNQGTQRFDRFATTFRKPDGTMPPPMSISEEHPAYANLMANKTHVGEVPVMGRLRLAYLIPIQASGGAIAGALAVDVGWVDDLLAARNELQKLFAGSAIAILVLVAGLGVWRMRFELQPLKTLARFADYLAAGKTPETVPYLDRTDEVGALANGLERVGDIQRDLTYLAYTDELTGLGNRSRYLADLTDVFAACKTKAAEWKLVHIHLDRFTDTNVAFGQAGGDQLLKQVGAALSSFAGPDGFVSRISGDQFSVLVPIRRHVSNDAEFGNELLQRLSAPFLLGVAEVHLSASAGTTILPQNAENSEEAHLNADVAVRKAKADGGNRCAAFAPDMYTTVHHQIELERMLRDAIKEREICVHFQPQINPKTNELTGLEALARWLHAEKGLIAPAEFIPVAESTGLIVSLGALVLDETCRQAREWLDEGFNFKHLAVNVSPMQLWQPDFVKSVRRALKRHNLAGHHLCLEVTESLFVDQEEGRVSAILTTLKDLGVSISLDDFGSGYSSLGYLNRLPFDQLKIDRGFIMNVDTDGRNQKLLAGIVSLGQGLGLSVVAEGAETKQEIDCLNKIGCDAAQGYFYAKPMPAKDVQAAVEAISGRNFSPKKLSA